MEAENRASPKINEARRSIEEYAVAVDAAAADVAAATSKMDRGMSAAATKTDDLQHAQQRLDHAMREQAAAHDGSDWITLAENVKRAEAEVHRMSTAVGDLNKREGELGVAAEEAATHVNHSTKAANEAGKEMSTLRRSLRDAQQGYRDARAAAAEFEKGAKDGATATKDAGVALHGTHRATQQLASGLKNVATEQRYVFDQMGRFDRFARLHAVLIAPFDNAVNAIKEFRSGLQAGASEMRTFGRHAEETAGEVHHLGDAIGQKLRPALASLQGAAAPAVAETRKVGDAARSSGSAIGGMSLKVAGMGLGLTSLAGPVAGLAGLAVPALFAGIGMAAEGMHMSIQRAMMSGQQLTAWQQLALPPVTALNQAFSGLHQPLMDAAQGIADTVVALGPQFQAAVAAMGPMVRDAGAGISDLVRNIVSGMLPALQQSEPLVKAFWSGLNTMVQGLGTALTSLDIGPAAQGLQLFGQAVGGLLPIAAQLLNALMPLGNTILGDLVPALGQLISSVITALKPALGVIADLIRQLSPVIASLAPVFEKLGPPITQIVAALAPVIVSFVKLLAAIAPILVPIAELAAALVSGLAPVLTKIFEALTPLMPEIIHLTEVLVDVLIKAVEPLFPAFMQLVEATLQILPAIIPLIPKIIELVIILAPLISDVLKLAAVFMTDLVPAIIAIIGWYARIADAMLGNLIPTFHDFVRVVSKVIHDVLRLGRDLLTFWGDVFTGHWSRLWDDAKEIIKAFGTYLKDLVGGFFVIGRDLVMGIARGIWAGATGLLDMAKKVGGSIAQAFKDALKIFSPSQVMADEVGRYIPLGIAAGITANMSAVASAAQMASQRALTGAKVGLNLSGGFSGFNPQSALGGGGGTNLQMVFTGNQIMSDRDITNFANRIGGVLAKSILPQAGVYIKG